MSKFTGGKWEVVVIYGDHYVIFSNDEVVADCFGSNANGRLIAAAPEMYDELYEVLQLLQGKSSYDGDEYSQHAEDIRELLACIDGKEATHEGSK